MSAKAGGGDFLTVKSSLSSLEGEGEATDTQQLPQIPDVPKPDYTDEELAELVEYVQLMTVLFALDQRDWNEKTLDIIRRWFLEIDHPMLTIFYDCNVLTACLGFPLAPVSDISYFLRSNFQLFTVEGFHDEVHFGTIHDDIDGCMLKILRLVYAPIFRNFKEWNENVRLRFCKALDKFLCFLTSLHYKMSGMTVIYVPYVIKQLQKENSAQDREFIKNLEELAVFWCTQIRTLLNDKTLVGAHDLVVPLEEFEFWQYRYEVLEGLCTQLDHEEVQQIVNMLRITHSVYLKQVEELIDECKLEMGEAKSNIRFLYLIVEPCRGIEKAESPSGVPPLIPRIIHLIRFIWMNSDFYFKRELITGLFRNVSNQILKLCILHTNVDKILNGNSRFGITMANMSIDCCMAYKVIYDRMSKEHSDRNPEFGWDLEYAMIFNHVDAFIERLNDVIDICESMIVFARLDETEIIPPPRFGGTEGKEFEKTARRVEKQFLHVLDVLRQNSRHTILNINSNEWYDQALRYRRTTLKLEETVQRLMSNAFQQVSNIEEALEVLNVTLFYSYSASIRKTYLRQVSSLWQMFSDEMAKTSKMLMGSVNVHESWLPYYASRTVNYRINIERLQWLRDRLYTSDWLPSVPESQMVLSKFEATKGDFEKEMRKSYEEWCSHCGSQTLLQRLQRTLLTKCKVQQGLLECNMDRTVLSICEQASHFERLGFQITGIIRMLYEKYATLKFVYNSVVTVCLDYNRILGALSESERKLFKALITACDRKISPGIVKLTWGGEMSDAYIADCAKYTAKLQDSLDIYKRSNKHIARACERICDTPLIKLTLSGPAELSVFELIIQSYSRKSTNSMLGFYNTVFELLVAVYKEFHSVIDEMATEWNNYVNNFDNMMELALLTSACNSLTNVRNAVTADGSIPPAPIIIVEADVIENKVTLTPDIETVKDMIAKMFQRIETSLESFPRICEKMRLPVEMVPQAYSKAFATDIQSLEIQQAILYELEYQAEEMETFLGRWEQYRQVWDTSEEEFVQTIHRTERTANVYDQYITYYSNLAEQVSGMESISQVHFVVVNQNNIKNTILDYIEKWQLMNIKLLSKRATSSIRNVYRYMGKNGARVQIVPRTLKEAREATEFYKKLVAHVPIKQAEFPPMLELFKLLDKYQIDIAEETRNLVLNLDVEWQNYLRKLIEADEMLENSRDDFKKGLLTQANKFRTVMKEFLADFLVKLPTSAQT